MVSGGSNAFPFFQYDETVVKVTRVSPSRGKTVGGEEGGGLVKVTVTALEDILAVPGLSMKEVRCRFGPSLEVQAEESGLRNKAAPTVECMPPKSAQSGPVNVTVSFNNGQQWLQTAAQYTYVQSYKISFVSQLNVPLNQFNHSAYQLALKRKIAGIDSVRSLAVAWEGTTVVDTQLLVANSTIAAADVGLLHGQALDYNDYVGIRNDNECWCGSVYAQFRRPSDQCLPSSACSTDGCVYEILSELSSPIDEISNTGLWHVTELPMRASAGSVYCQSKGMVLAQFNDQTELASARATMLSAGIRKAITGAFDASADAGLNEATALWAGGECIWSRVAAEEEHPIICKQVSPPSNAPTKVPTKAPTKVPTKVPTKAPTKVPTKAPTKVPITKGTALPLAHAPVY